MTVYAFLYNPCKHESGYITISIHLSEENAYKAMEAHKAEAYKEWLEQEAWANEAHPDRSPSPFGCYELWDVKPIEILP